jgi:hypothetical protein
MKKEIPYCVKHRDGWCALFDQRKTAYRDSVETRCGYFVVLPFAIERHDPTCEECVNKLTEQNKQSHA